MIRLRSYQSIQWDATTKGVVPVWACVGNLKIGDVILKRYYRQDNKDYDYIQFVITEIILENRVGVTACLNRTDNYNAKKILRKDIFFIADLAINSSIQIYRKIKL